MEHLETMYYKKDTHKTSLKKKQTKRKKTVESKPENFEIVIENAETSEVKCFNVNQHQANMKLDLNNKLNSVCGEDEFVFDKLIDEGHANNMEYERKRFEEEKKVNLDADTFEMNIKNSRDYGHENDNEIKDEIEYCFDSNGNEVSSIKRELNEPKHDDNALLDTDLWENDENVNHGNKTKLNSLEKTESMLWYIAAGYDLDLSSEDSKSKFEHISPEQVGGKGPDSFDISDIKIKEESIRSIKDDDALYENVVFANTSDEPDSSLDILNDERCFGGIESSSLSPEIVNYRTDNDYSIRDKYTLINDHLDSGITHMSTPGEKYNSWNQNVENTIIGKADGKDFDLKKTEHLTENRNRSCSDEKKSSARHSSLFPNLTTAIRNNSGKNQTDKKLQHDTFCAKIAKPEHASTNEPDQQNVEDAVVVAQTFVSQGSWRQVHESPVFVEEEKKKASGVKFTLKSRHSVHSFNAFGVSSREGNMHDNQNTSVVTVNQLSNPRRGVNKNAKDNKTNAKSDFSQIDKTLPWSSCYRKVSPEKVAEMAGSDEEQSLGKLVIDEEENNLLLSNAADDSNIDYNYVMLDGIMSLTLTGSGVLDRNSEKEPGAVENKTVRKENDMFSYKIHTSKDLTSGSSAHRNGTRTHSCSPRKVETGHSKIRPSIKTEVAKIGSDVIDGDTENCSEIKYQYCDDIKEEPSEIKIENYDADTQDTVFDKSTHVVAKVDESFISEFKDSVSFKETLSCIKPVCSQPATKAAKECFEDSEDNVFGINIKLQSDTESNRNLPKKNLNCSENEDDDENSRSSFRLHSSIPEPLQNNTFQYRENCEHESTEKYKSDSLHSSDNSATSGSDSDNEDEENDGKVVCESYRIIKRYFIDRCTGNTLQKILLRVKERKTYTDHELDDDEIEGKRSYKIEDKLRSDKYNKDYVKRLFGEEFNLRYLQENGLQYPILFSEKTGLGLRVPSDNFKVCDVKACVGSRRMLDVMDVNTQKGLEMTMKEWTRYYENTERDRLLNVISLEFSHTKLENYVESPNLVREIDWVDTAWPQHLKDCQTESTNAIDKMKYPKVQKYCLMSVAGCYTDFHIDFGGTSVWYHILHGEKIFWLIPPTDKNLAKYENWVLSGKQGDAFLADSIEECQMIQLVAGNTFIIPSGWIHAVFTPKDSLVFGGNFLHSFNMVNQLRVSAIEDKTHVPMKFRYPFYAEINWYVLERYVHSLTGVTYLEKPQLNEDLEVINSKVERDQANFEMLEEKLNKRLSVSLTRIDDTSPGRKSTSDDDSTASGPTRSPGQASTLPRTGRKSSSESANSLDLKSVDKPEIMKVPYKSPVKKKTKYVHLTKYELEGLIEVLGWVESLPPSKKGVPKDLIDPEAVLREVKRLIQEHMKDNPELAITGEPVLEWTKATKKLIKLKQKAKTAKLLGTHCAPKVKSAGGKNASGNRHRRVRCKKCEPCTRDDCMECNFCKDMRKYGGPGRAKQSCISRQCLAPILPKGIVCQICKMAQCLLDKPVKTDGAVDDDAEDYSSALMECGICWEIVHPLCLRRKNENLNNDGVLNEDLPNSWKCSKCCFDGKEGKLMARVFKGGWRPTPASTPPPLSVSPPLQPQSPAGSPQVMVTEGKRVTLNQGIDSKKTMPKLSPSPEHRGIDMKPLNGSARGDIGDTFTPLKAETFDDDKRLVQMEVTDTLPAKKEPADETFKFKTKRSSSPLEENPMKKKRNVSPSPSRPAKSSRAPGQPKSSPSSGRKPKNATPDLSTKRSKRETTPRSATRCTYDFDDDEEFMDISAPLPDKGKGRGIKGHKNLHLKTKDFSANLGSNGNKKSHLQTIEPKLEERGHLTKNSSEKLCGEQLRQTLISHIERRNLPVIKPQFVVRPAPMSPPDDYFLMGNGHKHPLSRKLWTYIFNFLSSADLARCQAVCQIWNRWCINPDLWKKIDLSKKRIVQTHLMGIVRRQPEYLDLSAVIMTQKQILWLLERIPLLKTLIVSKCSWATISGLCMSACPLLYKLDVSWATGLNDKCFEDLISPPVDRKPAVKNISRLHRLKSLHLSGTEVTDSALELMTLYLSQLEELNISYCTRITDRGIQVLASSKSPSQDSLKALNISGCRGLTEVSLDAIKNFSKLKELYATNCIRIPTEKCRSLRHPRLKTFKY